MDLSSVAETIKEIEIANILWGRAQVAVVLGDSQEAERLRDQYRERLREILENAGQ